MSEYVWRNPLSDGFHLTFCDRCYPVPPKWLRLFDDDGIMVDLASGIFIGGFDLAMTEGWEERDYGHVCPPCAKADNEELNESENVFLGREVLEAMHVEAVHGIEQEKENEQTDKGT